MPIYIADYEALEAEIRRVNQQAKGDSAQFLAKKELFENFYQDFLVDLQTTNIYLDKLFLTKKSRLLLPNDTTQSKLPREYYSELLHQLQQINRDEPETSFLILQQFNERTNLLIEEIMRVVVSVYLKYGFEQSFFLGIPRMLRNGLLRAIRLEKEEYEQLFTEKMTELPDVFFETLTMLLKSPEVHKQSEIVTSYIHSILGENPAYVTGKQLLASAQQHRLGTSFTEAFALIDPRLQKRLKDFF
jgi:hypothetical protein